MAELSVYICPTNLSILNSRIPKSLINKMLKAIMTGYSQWTSPNLKTSGLTRKMNSVKYRKYLYAQKITQ
jgi:hypothetical protein